MIGADGVAKRNGARLELGLISGVLLLEEEAEEEEEEEDEDFDPLEEADEEDLVELFHESIEMALRFVPTAKREDRRIGPFVWGKTPKKYLN